MAFGPHFSSQIVLNLGSISWFNFATRNFFFPTGPLIATKKNQKNKNCKQNLHSLKRNLIKPSN